jgi:hypothetical protein
VKGSDKLPPNLVLKSADLTLDASGKATLLPAQVAAGSTDNCGAINYSLSKSVFDCTNLGNNSVTIVATDLSGNSMTGTVTVRIIDNAKPVVTCPPNIIQAACNNVVYAMPVAADNCKVNSLSLVSGQLSGTAFKPGTTKVAWRALDAFGNESTCSFDVTVGNNLTAVVNNVVHATNSQSNGKVNFTVSGGTSPYTLAWSKGGVFLSNFDPQMASSGAYQLHATDAGGCTASTGIFTIENLTAINEEPQLGKIKLQPNPVKDILTIEYELPELQNLEVTGYDLHGRRLFRKNITGISGIILVDEYKWHLPGVYLLKIKAGEKIIMKKVMKM